MIDTAGIDLVTLVERDGITLRGTATKHGPCPKCGGTDRLSVKTYDGKDWFRCNQCHTKWGDAVEFVMWRDDVTLPDALATLGLRGNAPKENRHPSKAKPKTAAGIEIPEALDKAPAADWQAAAAAFVVDCAANLWTPAGAKTLAYLRGRGLTDETIRAYGLGWHWPAKSAGVKLAGQWWAARGIVIPRTYGGELWAVNVRRSKADYDRPDDGNKLMLIAGSKTQLFNADMLGGDDVRAVLVCGGEFDAMLAQQHAPAGVACVTFGSEGKRPTWEAEALLRGMAVHIVFDNDTAGDEGAAKWAALGARVRVPAGKDVTEYVQQGGDLGMWMAETCGVFPWQPPTDVDQQVAEARRWLTVFDDEAQPGFTRARAWARMNVCAGETVASDGQAWLTLAQ